MNPRCLQSRLRNGFVLACLLAMHPESLAGIINLEWRPAYQVVTPGETVSVGLYAVSDDATDDAISVMDVVLVWDPSLMSLLGVLNNGPYNWLSSGLPVNAIGGLNLDLTDGDATYTARSQFSPPPGIATPAGLLVTTVQFTALAETAGTILSIPEQLGAAKTIIVGDVPGLDIHGTLGNATVVVESCSVVDLDADGDVDLSDFAAFQRCYGETEGAGSTECLCVFDRDRDGDLDLDDYALFETELTGPL